MKGLSPLRVLLCATTKRTNLGGVESVADQLAADLGLKGVDLVRAWYHTSSGDPPDALVFPYLRGGLDGQVAPTRLIMRRARALFLLWWQLRRARPDVVNLHFIRSDAWFFLRLRHLLRYRVVLSFHGSDILLATDANRALLPRLIRDADAITAVSERVRDAVCECGHISPKHVTVIPNGIPLDFWQSPAETSSRRIRTSAITVGRLVPVKGHDVLIEAIVLLRSSHPGLRLTIVGDGPLREQLEQQIEMAGLSDVVTMTGRQNPEAIRKLLREHEVFVLPSRSEGLPLSLLEAMACGTPAIATTVGGNAEVLTSDTGILVPPDDAQALSLALSNLWNSSDVAHQMGAAASVRASAFAASRVADEFLRAFQSVVRQVE